MKWETYQKETLVYKKLNKFTSHCENSGKNVCYFILIKNSFVYFCERTIK